MADDDPTPPAPPLLRVVRGEPTPEELAALLTVLTARPADGTRGPEATAPSLWSSREAGLRRPLRAGPGAWRAAGLVPGARTRAAP